MTRPTTQQIVFAATRHTPTYRIAAEQIAAAEQAQADFAAIQSEDPTAKLPVSYRQMILNEERHSLTWNARAGQYEPENK